MTKIRHEVAKTCTDVIKCPPVLFKIVALMAKARLVTDEARANASRKHGYNATSPLLELTSIPHFSQNKVAEQNSSGIRVDPTASPSGSALISVVLRRGKWALLFRGAAAVQQCDHSKQQLMRDDAAVSMAAADRNG